MLKNITAAMLSIILFHSTAMGASFLNQLIFTITKLSRATPSYEHPVLEQYDHHGEDIKTDELIPEIDSLPIIERSKLLASLASKRYRLPCEIQEAIDHHEAGYRNVLPRIQEDGKIIELRGEIQGIREDGYFYRLLVIESIHKTIKHLLYCAPDGTPLEELSLDDPEYLKWRLQKPSSRVYSSNEFEFIYHAQDGHLYCVYDQKLSRIHGTTGEVKKLEPLLLPGNIHMHSVDGRVIISESYGRIY